MDKKMVKKLDFFLPFEKYIDTTERINKKYKSQHHYIIDKIKLKIQ